MITRIWHGRTKKEDAEIYRNYVMKTGVPEYQNSDGNLDVQILQRDDGDVTHIWTVTKWQDYESIKSFAGKEISKAKYYPEDEKYLLELEPNVIHCRTFSFSNSRVKNYINQLTQLFGGDSWNDESYMEKLKSVNEQIAFAQPLPGKHSVAEILWHVIYWKTILIKQIQGDFEFRKRTEKEFNFLPVEKLKQKGWINLVAEFKQTHETLIAMLNERDDNFLQEEFSPGKSFDYQIDGIIHHDIYHLGQIGLVISLLKNKRIEKQTGLADLHQLMFII
ncbi:MAG: DinB family protein [Bacteroidota bacterium]